jgi:dienelactone hydrolase
VTRAGAAAAGAAGLALLFGRASAEGPPAPPPPQTVSIETADGFKLAATLYEPGGGGEGKPAVLALHHEGGNRGAWKALGERAARQGITLLAPDLRGHGESRMQKETDLGPQAEARDPALWKAMSADADAGLKYLRATLICDAKKVGVIGLGAGAGLALLAAEKDEKVRAAYGVAPAPSACGLAGMAAATRWKVRPVGMVVGSADEKGDAAPLAKEIRKQARGEVVVLPTTEKKGPAEFLALPRTAAEAVQFFVGWFERPVLTGKPEGGVSRGGGIFVAGSSIGTGSDAGGILVHGYEAPGNITGLLVLADPTPGAKKLSEGSRRITLTPGRGKEGGLSAVVDQFTGGAWKREKAVVLLDCGAFVVEGKTTFFEAWLSPGMLGVEPFTKVAILAVPLIDGQPKKDDDAEFGGKGKGKGRGRETDPSSWQEWELR